MKENFIYFSFVISFVIVILWTSSVKGILIFIVFSLKRQNQVQWHIFQNITNILNKVNKLVYLIL